jgi:hypothetical protein
VLGDPDLDLVGSGGFFLSPVRIRKFLPEPAPDLTQLKMLDKIHIRKVFFSFKIFNHLNVSGSGS